MLTICKTKQFKVYSCETSDENGRFLDTIARLAMDCKILAKIDKKIAILVLSLFVGCGTSQYQESQKVIK